MQFRVSSFDLRFYFLILLCLFTIRDATISTVIFDSIIQPACELSIRVADVNNSLVDDGLVDKEKIGGSNFFWSFPGKKDRTLQLEHEKIIGEIEMAKTTIAEAEAKLADAKRGREDEGGDRAKKLARLGELRKEKASMESELESLKENDPQALADLEKELKLVTEAANRWTDNIFSVSFFMNAINLFFLVNYDIINTLIFFKLKCKSYLIKKRGMTTKEACKLLGISSEFDCKYFSVLVKYTSTLRSNANSLHPCLRNEDPE